MTRALNIPDPRLVASLTLLVFSAWLALEGAFMLSVPQLLIAVTLFAVGWSLRRRGVAALSDIAALGGRERFRRWVRFCARDVPVFFAAYVIGYFALMDRHSPTSPAGAYNRFDSSFRWVSREWISKGVPPHYSPWRDVTTWNILYQPMDRLWFHFFPRSEDEVRRLRERGYWW